MDTFELLQATTCDACKVRLCEPTPEGLCVGCQTTEPGDGEPLSLADNEQHPALVALLNDEVDGVNVNMGTRRAAKSPARQCRPVTSQSRAPSQMPAGKEADAEQEMLPMRTAVTQPFVMHRLVPGEIRELLSRSKPDCKPEHRADAARRAVDLWNAASDACARLIKAGADADTFEGPWRRDTGDAAEFSAMQRFDALRLGFDPGSSNDGPAIKYARLATQLLFVKNEDGETCFSSRLDFIQPGALDRLEIWGLSASSLNSSTEKQAAKLYSNWKTALCFQRGLIAFERAQAAL